MYMQKAENLPDTLMLYENSRWPAAEPLTPAAEPDMPAACIVPGFTVGNYRVDSVLGEGGMGMVYKAHDLLLNRTVALKVLPPRLLQNRDFLHRFRTEAQAQARLNSPNVVTLYSLLEVPAGLILVMEYVEGQTLDKRIQSGLLSVDEAVRIFNLVLQGVESAHQMGIVHRDLKPGNIFITAQNEIKIMDFGVARILDSRDHTLAGSMLGTLLYIAPEQINGKEADFRSDIYTVGISLFEAVTGRLPFERTTDYSLMHAHILEKPPKPRTLRRKVPKQLERVILKAIEKDPFKRFQSAAEFRVALVRHANPGLAALLRPTRAPVKSPLLLPALHRSVLNRRGGKDHRLVSLGFDLMLIAIVAGLVFSLGLLPAKNKASATDAAMRTPAAGNAPAMARKNKDAPFARRASTENYPRQRNTKRSEATHPNSSDAASKANSPPAKNYDALKKAWGGS